jgi:hypothetical protein
MDQQNNQTQPPAEAVEQQPRARRPNETGSISVEGFVQIFDPNTKEKFVEKRA